MFQRKGEASQRVPVQVDHLRVGDQKSFTKMRQSVGGVQRTRLFELR